MKHILEVCLIALTLNASITLAQSESTPTLRAGISVQMVVSGSATPMPAADNEDALVVTVTDSGAVYLGITPLAPAALAEQIKDLLSNREQRLYIKADARTPYANVVKVLEAARTTGVTAPVLLTTQPEPAAPGTIAAPRGLEVFVGAATSGSQSILVQLFSGQRGPFLTINRQAVAWDGLATALRKALQNTGERLVSVKADGALSFADVAHVIDACESARAKATLITPEL
jgi:biopolymer transport protein ExbD